MSDFTEEKISGLEDRMEHMEKMLTEIGKKINKIEVGLFGDDKMDYRGLLERVKKLEDEISAVKKVNDNQEISINARNSFSDLIVLWARRIFWIIAALTGLIYLITGKVGLADIIKFAK